MRAARPVTPRDEDLQLPLPEDALAAPQRTSARARKHITVLDLAGLPAVEASERVRAGGLVPAIEAVDEPDERLRGIVTAQEPDPGSELSPGATVSLLVARPPTIASDDPSSAPPLPPEPADAAPTGDRPRPDVGDGSLTSTLCGLPADEDWFQLPAHPHQAPAIHRQPRTANPPSLRVQPQAQPAAPGVGLRSSVDQVLDAAWLATALAPHQHRLLSILRRASPARLLAALAIAILAARALIL